MKYARKLTWKPDIQDVSFYGRELLVWYASIMPPWRRVGADGWRLSRNAPAGDAGWDVLMKGGGNGIFIIILSIVWWRDAAKDEADLALVQEALKDLRWTFDAMLRSVGALKAHVPAPRTTRTSPTKRSASEELATPRTRSRMRYAVFAFRRTRDLLLFYSKEF